MKSLRALKAAGLILAAVLLGLATVQGSYALWNAAVESPAEPLQAADFSIKVNGTDMRAGRISIPLGTPVAKGAATYAKVEVANAVNVPASSPLNLRLDAKVYAPDDTLNGNLKVRTAALTAGRTCENLPATAYKESVANAPAAYSLPLPVAAAQTLCVQLSVAPNTPSALMGNTFAVNADLAVAQVAPLPK